MNMKNVKKNCETELYEKGQAMVRQMDATYEKNEALCKNIKAAELRIGEEFDEVEETCTKAVAAMIYMLVLGAVINIGICVLVCWLMA
jgi:hypothetical protein